MSDFDDIKVRIYSNLSLQSNIRKYFLQEWNLLEKRIKENEIQQRKQGAVEVLEKWVKKLEEYNFSFVKEMKKELKELDEGVEK
jgi:hypothetical protein